MQVLRIPAVVAAFAFLATPLHATSTLPLSLAERARLADAICIGEIGSSVSFTAADGGIWTQTAVQVDTALKGAFPSTVYLRHRGGAIGGIAERRSDMPSLPAGETRLLFLKQRDDGTIFANGGPAGVLPADGAFGHALVSQIRAQYANAAAAGVDLNNTAAGDPIRQPSVVTDFLLFSDRPARFIEGDHDQPIGYLVDMDALPSGITTNTALTALSNAFQAWTEVTSLTFQYRGNASFGQAAATVAQDDAFIRVQMHDTFNQVNGNLLLGSGGSFAFTSVGVGGTVAGEPFGKTARGYLMIEHTNTTLSDPVALEEVLGHEIGHVIGLAHSSTNENESDSTLREALMFFQIHNDGRGARLGDFDRTTVLQAYPTNNTPPVAFGRLLHAVTHVTQSGDTNAAGPQVPGINEVELAVFDRQPVNLSLQLQSVLSANGTFEIDGMKVKYNARGFFGGPTFDPFSTSVYNQAQLVATDGTNLSAPVFISVKSLFPDRFPANASDGLPDEWMTSFFGDADPAQVQGFSVAGDADGDGISNLDEFRIGSDPTDAASVLMFLPSTQNQTLNFTSTIGELYQAEYSTDLINWAVAAMPVQATGANTVISNFLNGIGESAFFRVQRVP